MIIMETCVSSHDVYLEDYGALKLVYYVAVLSSSCFLPAYLMTSRHFTEQINNSCYGPSGLASCEFFSVIAQYAFVCVHEQFTFC